jgi:hypothetical protein
MRTTSPRRCVVLSSSSSASRARVPKAWCWRKARDLLLAPGAEALALPRDFRLDVLGGILGNPLDRHREVQERAQRAQPVAPCKRRPAIEDRKQMFAPEQRDPLAAVLVAKFL